MTNNFFLQPSYILHRRPYRDTSLLIEVLTQSHGRLHLVAKGVRSTQSKLKGVLQPFVPLLISWRGRSDLKTLCHAEGCAMRTVLPGNILMYGFYLNELLVRLFPLQDACPAIYSLYQECLASLSQDPWKALRRFEKYFLAELGYAPSLNREALSGLPLQPHQIYYFDPAQGLLTTTSSKTLRAYTGENLLAIYNDEFNLTCIKQEAKYLFRSALNHLLEGKRIKSRELLNSMYKLL